MADEADLRRDHESGLYAQVGGGSSSSDKWSQSDVMRNAQYQMPKDDLALDKARMSNKKTPGTQLPPVENAKIMTTPQLISVLRHDILQVARHYPFVTDDANKTEWRTT